MTNNQLCTLIGIIGSLVAFFSMGFMFFGITSALWGAIAGLALDGIALVSFD